MLEVIYNDSYSQLTLVNNLNKEGVVIVDDDFKVYGEISYEPYQPTNDDFLYLWQQAISTYFHIGEENEPLGAYRQNMFEKSLGAFKEWLEKGGEYRGQV